MEKRILVMGDIHGELKFMEDLLKQANYDYQKDQLVLIGDYIDRGPKSKEVVSKVKELTANGAIALMGNHEKMMIDALTGDNAITGCIDHWYSNGGEKTVKSYKSFTSMEEDIEFLKKLLYTYVTDNYIFVHGGIQENIPMDKQNKEFLIWARPEDFEDYSAKSHGNRLLVCGHTPTQSLMGDSNYDKPIQIKDTIFIDTGSFFSGKLSLVELPSKSFWQS